jgi:hypothetical protein
MGSPITDGSCWRNARLTHVHSPMPSAQQNN